MARPPVAAFATAAFLVWDAIVELDVELVVVGELVFDTRVVESVTFEDGFALVVLLTTVIVELLAVVMTELLEDVVLLYEGP